jgi:hypothetical protein
MNDRAIAAAFAEHEAIHDGIERALEGKRWYLTPEEFLANVEAHKRKHDRERLNPKLINHTPAQVIEYRLKPFFIWNRQMEFREVAK